MAWTVERVVHFGPDELIKDGLTHFGFWDRCGRHIGIAHERHLAVCIDAAGEPAWTVAAEPVYADVPNIRAPLDYPMFADALPDGTLLISSFGSAALYRIDAGRREARVVVDGHALGMRDMGNCVVDDEATIWVNEVTGCRVWRFDAEGQVLQVFGDGEPGFQADPARFDEVRFGWIYDLRRGPDGQIYVLDSGNYALRVIDVQGRSVITVAGSGKPGDADDGILARRATFGGDPSAQYDGPISLALDEDGNAFVGDRFNRVVRRIDHETCLITTIAGRADPDDSTANDPHETDPRRLNLPMISSLDYARGRLYVPTDLAGSRGDLAVLSTADD